MMSASIAQRLSGRSLLSNEIAKLSKSACPVETLYTPYLEVHAPFSHILDFRVLLRSIMASNYLYCKFLFVVQDALIRD